MNQNFQIKSFQLTLLLILLCSLGGLASAQDSSRQLLNVEIAATKTDFLLLEPVVLKFDIKHNFNEAELNNANTLDNLGDARLEIRHAGRRCMVGLWDFLEMTPPDEPTTIYQLIQTDLVNLFPAAGSYQLQLVIPQSDNRKKSVSKSISKSISISNTITIDIVEPKGLESLAFEWLKQLKTDPYLALSESIDAQHRLAGFVANYRKTVYGDYAAYRLAESYLAQEKFAAATELLEILSHKPDSGFYEQVLFDLYRSYLALGDAAKANYYQAVLESEFPHSLINKKIKASLAEQDEAQ